MLGLLFISVILWGTLVICLWKIHLTISELAFLFIYSLFAVLVAVFFETKLLYGIKLISKNFLITSISVACIEECTKLLMFVLCVNNHFIEYKDDNKIYKLKIIAVLFALVFAYFENIGYYIYSETTFTRILSTIFHAGISIFYVDFIFKSHNKFILLAVMILFHAIYNFSSIHIYYFVLVGAGILLFFIVKIFRLFFDNQKKEHNLL